MNRDSEAKYFEQLEFEDKDLITITDLRLVNRKEQVHMVISLKRNIQTELLTTYLPTVLLLIITFVTIFFKAEFFEASLSVNLTIMLVMTTIFTSKIEELPPTSDTKMIDLWLIFCLLIPFAFTVVQTAIECHREEDNEEPRPASTVNVVRSGKGAESGLEEPNETWAESRGEENSVEANGPSFNMLRTLQYGGWP